MCSISLMVTPYIFLYDSDHFRPIEVSISSTVLMCLINVQYSDTIVCLISVKV